MVRLQTLDLRIGVRVPASQPNRPPSDHMRSSTGLFSSALKLFERETAAGDKQSHQVRTSSRRNNGN